jgi:hypothetical protein
MLAAVAVLNAVTWQSALADFIFITCGPSAGSTYYMEGGRVTSANAGWKKDGVNAKLQLLIKDDKSFDLISKGAPPNDFSYSDHGCNLSRLNLSTDKNELVVSAQCPKQLEVFFFKWNDDKTGELVQVDIASSELTKHGGALHATCQIGEH